MSEPTSFAVGESAPLSSKAIEMRAYRARHPEKQRERLAERRIIIDNLKNVPCMDCGGAFPPECMDFDHRPDEIKSFTLNSGIYRNIESLLIEAAKCDVVCANCHRIRTRRRKV